MEILTKEELQSRFKVDSRTVEAWMRLGMPHLRLPGRFAKPGTPLRKHGPVRFVFEKTVAWLEAVNAAGATPELKPEQKGGRQ